MITTFEDVSTTFTVELPPKLTFTVKTSPDLVTELITGAIIGLTVILETGPAAPLRYRATPNLYVIPFVNPVNVYVLLFIKVLVVEPLSNYRLT